MKLFLVLKTKLISIPIPVISNKAIKNEIKKRLMFLYVPTSFNNFKKIFK